MREINIYNANYGKISNVIQTAESLERIRLEFLADHINNLDEQNKKRLHRILVELLNQMTLQCIMINIDRDIDLILNVLKEIDWSHRKEMRFCLETKHRIDKVLEYLNTLEGKLRINSNDYVLRMQFVLTENMVDVTKKVNIGDTVNKRPMEDGQFIDVVWTNDVCKLDGYRERWIHLEQVGVCDTLCT